MGEQRYKEVGSEEDGEGERKEKRKETKVSGYTQIFTNKSVCLWVLVTKSFTQSDLNG